jgi:alanyl aminopeptidase
MVGTVIRNLYPEFETNLSLGRSSAFAGDQSTSTQPIRSEIKTEKDYGSDFGLRYSKGQAILGMLESYVGPAAWQKAIRQYVRDFAWGNATDYDLWKVVSRESGMDVTRIANDFLNQPGYALLTFDKDGKVSQERYMPYGIEAQDLHWRIPLTVKYKKDGQVRETFYLLDDRTGALDIPRGADWLYPDAEAMGYYRWQIDPAQFTALVGDMGALSNREQKALLDNSEALWAARKQSISDYLDVVDQLLEHEHPLVFQSALTAIADIGEELVQEEDRALYAAYLNRRLSGRFAEFGVEYRPGDSEAIIKMRPSLMALLGSYGGNPDVIRAAEALTQNFFENPASVEAVLAAAALTVVAENDEAGKRYADYIKAYENAQAQIQKTIILRSMTFKNPEVVGKHLDFSISPAVAAGDAALGVGTFSTILDDHSILYDWMDKNIDAFQAKIPEYMHAFLPQIMAGVCSPANRKMLNEFFADRGEVYAASLAKALERTDQCIARKAREHGDFRAWLESVARNPA